MSSHRFHLFFLIVSQSSETGIFLLLEFESAIFFKLCMWTVAQGTVYLICRPKYVSSRPLPAWTWGSAHTCGAIRRLWDDTIGRYLAKPAWKAIAAPRQHKNAKVIATIRGAQTASRWNSFQDHACEDELICRSKLVLIWVWYPWLYLSFCFVLFFTWEIWPK